MLDRTPMQDQQYPPYHIQGRWYKVEYVWDDDDYKPVVTKSDLPDAAFYNVALYTLGGDTLYGDVLFMGKGFKLIDWKIDGNIDQSESGDGACTPGYCTINGSYTGLDTMEIGLSIGDEHAQVFMSGTIYLFGYFE